MKLSLVKYLERGRTLIRRAVAWLKAKWRALLITLGVIASVPVLLAQPVNFSYVAASSYVDGSPMALSDITETRLYCNGSVVQTKPGADGSFNPDLTPGTYTCYATHVVGTLESDPSNEVIRDVTVRPSPPQGLTVE